MSSKHVWIFAAASATFIFSPNANAQPSDEYVVVSAHIDNVRGPRDLFGTAADCQNNAICAAAMSAISNATGIPIDQATAALAAISGSREGEGSFTLVGLPAGYNYCTSSFKLTSIVPRDGDRGSTLLLEARDENLRGGVAAETWTPVQGFGVGRSWVEGDLTVVGVRGDLAGAAWASQKCNHVTNDRRAFLACRGSGCEGLAIDRGHTVSTSPTGAGERRD